MQKRYYKIDVRLTEKELEEFNEKAAACGINKGSYIRLAIKNECLKEARPKEAVEVIAAIKRIGSYLDLLQKEAKAQGLNNEAILNAMAENFEIEVMLLDRLSNF